MSYVWLKFWGDRIEQWLWIGCRCALCEPGQWHQEILLHASSLMPLCRGFCSFNALWGGGGGVNRLGRCGSEGAVLHMCHKRQHTECEQCVFVCSHALTNCLMWLLQRDSLSLSSHTLVLLSNISCFFSSSSFILAFSPSCCLTSHFSLSSISLSHSLALSACHVVFFLSSVSVTIPVLFRLFQSCFCTTYYKCLALSTLSSFQGRVLLTCWQTNCALPISDGWTSHSKTMKINMLLEQPLFLWCLFHQSSSRAHLEPVLNLEPDICFDSQWTGTNA